MKNRKLGEFTVDNTANWEGSFLKDFLEVNMNRDLARIVNWEVMNLEGREFGGFTVYNIYFAARHVFLECHIWMRRLLLDDFIQQQTAQCVNF